jgi:oligopeptide transport system substrate-binding protein
MYNFKRFALLSLILVLALSLAGGVLAQEEGEKVIVMDSGPSDVPTIDPALSSDTQSNDIIEHVFVSLTRVNEVTAEVEPGFATSWEVDEESKTYTFNLLQEVPWVRFNPEAGEVEQVLDDEGNVRYVTAQDFVYGWQRTLNPETASDYAYVPAPWVVGGAEFNAGEADANALAVTAVDDYTLQINATEVTGFVPLIYGLWMVGAQPQWTIEANGDAWTEIGNYHTFGPFTVSEWLRDESITMVKNPYWPGSEYVPQASIDKIVQLIIDESAALDSYEAGNLNYVSSVPSAALPRIQTDPVLSQELNIGTDFCSYYYGFNVTKEPLDNVHLRRALSYAVDRQSIVDNVTQGGQVPGQWFSRPGLVAAPTLESHPDLGMYYDPALAQEELALALADLGLESADELPAITLMHNVSEGHARIAQAIQQMWTDELGVPVQIATQEWAVYLDLLDEDPPQIFRLGWCMDYPDAHNFLADVFREDSDNNHTLWGNAEYEALLDEAMLMADPEARQELYAAAEDILVYEDAAIIPIYWYTTVQINKPELERTFSIIGQERYEKWDIAQ